MASVIAVSLRALVRGIGEGTAKRLYYLDIKYISN